MCTTFSSDGRHKRVGLYKTKSRRAKPNQVHQNLKTHYQLVWIMRASRGCKLVHDKIFCQNTSPRVALKDIAATKIETFQHPPHLLCEAAMDANEKGAQAFTSSAVSCIVGALPNRSCECMLCNKIPKAVDAAFFRQPSDVGEFVAAY
ncbi:hypothetical protein PsorP6_002185 [Peronosclerospora sorghi]|uniref:Uncharacterized protein n=1 Tax=Peronosclerospora sorghi TaxID=230839 RepID=A0ACC0WU85_9STRA|nr:hypothetical protein PsorP6_002185 [Peronosclerospora sorghi]